MKSETREELWHTYLLTKEALRLTKETLKREREKHAKTRQALTNSQTRVDKALYLVSLLNK